MKADLLIRNAGQLCTLSGPEGPRRGHQLADIGVIADGAVASLDGDIVAAGPESEVLRELELDQETIEVDAGGALVTPGFVDPHTHAMFGRYRADEYALRVAGKPYVEIAAMGGGIHASVSDFNKRSDEELLEMNLRRLRRMILSGSTTIEVKSGYALNLDNELRALELISHMDRELPIPLIATFLGAHEIPPKWRENREVHIREIVETWLVKVAEQGIARFADIFCEPTVFTLTESEYILSAARELGLRIKIHADEIAPGYGAAALAARLGACSADHLIVMSDADMPVLAASDTVAVLLPATSLGLASVEFAPARKMIESGIAVALATDFNPGSSCTESMGFVLSLACSALRMTPAEALCAATHNAAWACGEGTKTGSLVPGKRADILIHDCLDFRELPYHMGFNSVRKVFAGGQDIGFSANDIRDIVPLN
ncbi:MAG: imidazolonepropionase [bacterium]|nr:imidazolonepropionase [bacterium]